MSIEKKPINLELNLNKKLTNKKININTIDKIDMSSKTTTTKPMSPLIKWSGGKKDELKQFLHYIPTFNTYLEPFIGGGAVFFHLNPEKSVIADVHKELIDLYTAVKNEKSDDIYKFMEEHPNEEAVYYEVRNKMPITDYLDSAKRFFYQRKTCFRGMLRYNSSGKFNIPFGRYKTYNFEILKNKSYEKLLKNTEILCKDFSYIFDNYNDENNFMFLDPPYDSKFTDYGYCSFGKNEHEKLAKCFKSTSIKCLMIIGKTDYISELYKDYIVDEYDKQYRFKLHSGRVGDEINTKHLIIKNY
jgi:DNA adenine methylase